MVDLSKSIKGSFFYAQKQKEVIIIIKFKQMENGYYLFTYESNGVTLQRVFSDPMETVDIKELKPVEKSTFSIEIDI